MRLSTAAERWSRSAHSHTVATRHPRPSNSASTRRSLSRLPLIFPDQNTFLVFGHLKYRHLCPCQKQPCTNTTHSCLGKTMSGRPGSELSSILKRRPRRCSADRTCRSGPVSVLLTARIMRERVGDTLMRVSPPFAIGGGAASESASVQVGYAGA